MSPLTLDIISSQETSGVEKSAFFHSPKGHFSSTGYFGPCVFLGVDVLQ